MSINQNVYQLLTYNSLIVKFEKHKINSTCPQNHNLITNIKILHLTITYRVFLIKQQIFNTVIAKVHKINNQQTCYFLLSITLKAIKKAKATSCNNTVK